MGVGGALGLAPEMSGLYHLAAQREARGREKKLRALHSSPSFLNARCCRSPKGQGDYPLLQAPRTKSLLMTTACVPIHT
jgi:hypothetical protein